jgi:hypothetical protein
MQVKQIILAVAATLVAGQVLAAPVTKTEIANAGAANIDQTWITGASAPNFNLYDAYAKGCDVNTVAIFTNATSTATATGTSGNFNAYACRRSNKISILFHTSDGGSFNAYAPHLTGTAPDGGPMPVALKRIADLGTIACTPNATEYTPPAAADYVSGGQKVPVYTSCVTVTPTTAPTLPAGGFSDVEAAMWGYDVSGAGTEGDAGVQQAFGVAVTTKLYRALQVAQGIYTTEALANTNDASFLPANAPNLTSAQYTSIIASNSGYQTDWSPILGTAGVGKNIYVARRVASSGTQAASNAFFLSNPCASGGPGGSLSPTGQVGAAGSTYFVALNSGSSDVRNMLVAINGGTYAHDLDGPTNPGTATLAVNGANQGFGIGVLSVENDDNNANWKYVKLDGVHPEGRIGTRGGVAETAASTTAATAGRATMMEGDYKFVMEMKSFVANTADAFGAGLIPVMATQMANPVDCAATPRGLAITPTAGSACAVGAQVSRGTKGANTCSPMQLFF